MLRRRFSPSKLVTIPQTSILYRTRAFQAVPKVYKPYVANTLKPIGNGLPDLIALGMDEPARTMEARSASSTP